MEKEQMNLLNACLRGFYSNSFFHIYVDGEFNLDISQIAEQKDKGTVLHEYTHYIQNIGTLWGQYCSLVNYETIIEFKKSVYSASELKRPYQIPLTESLVRKLNYMCHGNGMIGYPRWNIAVGEHIDVKSEDVVVNGKPFTKVILTVTLTDGSQQQIELGAHIIKESMAAMYQSLLDPSAKHDDVPYNLIAKLAEQHFPNAAKDIRMLICCCHTSLFSMSPGSSLIEILTEAEGNPGISGFSLFDHYAHSKLVTTAKGEKLAMPDYFNYMVEGFIKLLEANLFADLDYISTALERVKLDGKFYPFLSVMYDNNGFEDKNLTDIMSYYGIPYIQTSMSGISFPQGQTPQGAEGSLDVLELIAQEALYNNFVNPERMYVCPLYYMCQGTQYEKPECFTNPWEGNMCTYTIVSEPLGLRDKIIH